MDNQGLAIHLANAMSNKFRERSSGTMGAFDDDEFKQEALLALYRACEEYDPSKGFAFSTRAHKIINNALLNLVRKGSSKGRTFMRTELDVTPGHEDDDDQDNEWVTDPNAPDMPSRVDSQSVLKDAINQATSDRPPRDRKILLALMDQGDAFSYRDIAKEYDITQTYVMDIINRALPKIRRYMKDKNIAGFDSEGNLLDKGHVRGSEHRMVAKRRTRHDNKMAVSESFCKFVRLCEKLTTDR